MASRQILTERQEQTELIIAELLEDGSDPDALYTIEHHFSAEQFDLLETAAVEAFKLGYEVTDAEETELEDGTLVFSCDVISEAALRAELINVQVEQLSLLAERCQVSYDGWGTYFEDPDGEDEEDHPLIDEDDTGLRH